MRAVPLVSLSPRPVPKPPSLSRAFLACPLRPAPTGHVGAGAGPGRPCCNAASCGASAPRWARAGAPGGPQTALGAVGGAGWGRTQGRVEGRLHWAPQQHHPRRPHGRCEGGHRSQEDEDQEQAQVQERAMPARRPSLGTPRARCWQRRIERASRPPGTLRRRMSRMARLPRLVSLR